MQKNNQGFSLFAVLIALTLITIVGVVAFVSLKKPVTVSGLPSSYVPSSPQPNSEVQVVPSVAPEATLAPAMSSSTDLQVIGKELDDTKVNSVDAEFNTMNTSASSL